MRTVFGDVVAKKDWDYILELVREQQFTRQPWTLRPALISADGAIHEYIGQDYDPAQFKWVDEGWHYDRCELCGCDINEGDEGMTPDGRNWLCFPCFDICIVKNDSHPDHTLLQIETEQLEILCWLNWYDGPVNGLMMWDNQLYWFDYVDRWGVDEEADIWEEDWGYIYEVFALTETQIIEAVTWFKEKQDWFENKRFHNEGIKLRDWEGPKLPPSGIAMFTDKSGLKGGDHKDFGLRADFKIPQGASSV